MAGTIVHLMIAQKLHQILLQEDFRYVFDGRLKPERDFFIAGNICPDGIMARKGYQRYMKLHSHFRDDIPDGSFEKPGMVSLFERRMWDFWEKHIIEERQFPGLYLGYITHMMTDEFFILKERPKFFQKIAAIGLTQSDRETFIRFNRETDGVDFQLLEEFPELIETKEALERVPAYEIKGMVTEEELTASRNWILQHFFYQPHTQEKTMFLEYDSILAFIRETVQDIKVRILKEGYLQ